MTFQELASEIAHREGKKHEASISDIREILKTLKSIILENPLALVALLVGGNRKK